jgi:hypothetical protein
VVNRHPLFAALTRPLELSQHIYHILPPIVLHEYAFYAFIFLHLWLLDICVSPTVMRIPFRTLKQPTAGVLVHHRLHQLVLNYLFLLLQSSVHFCVAHLALLDGVLIAFATSVCLGLYNLPQPLCFSHLNPVPFYVSPSCMACLVLPASPSQKTYTAQDTCHNFLRPNPPCFQ